MKVRKIDNLNWKYEYRGIKFTRDNAVKSRKYGAWKALKPAGYDAYGPHLFASSREEMLKIIDKIFS